jgi:predicted RNA-binding Zn-ribbon protein involved in translation (DUF1610 family)
MPVGFFILETIMQLKANHNYFYALGPTVQIIYIRRVTASFVTYDSPIISSGIRMLDDMLQRVEAGYQRMQAEYDHNPVARAIIDNNIAPANSATYFYGYCSRCQHEIHVSTPFEPSGNDSCPHCGDTVIPF